LKSRSAFEERLINYSSEGTLKSAKQLLKNEQIKSAFRDANGVLHAVFKEKNGFEIHTHLQQNEPVRCQCSCAAANDRNNEETLCMHAVALWMYAGLFRVPNQLDEAVDTDAAAYVGLKNAGLEALARECVSGATAEVVINAESAFPHVPSKWENAVLSVRLRSGKREYLGNLNNLRQLFFDKVLAVQLKLSDFSLLDRQIIRFLAINGEAENSNILLNSELTGELFHTLGNFRNFYRNNRRVIIHNEAAAHPVVLARTGKDAREYSPGIKFGNALLEIHSAKVITGKSGCWVGKNGEYFWLNADCEIGFLRNFYRLGKWTSAMPGCSDFLKNMPFELIKLEDNTLSVKPAAIVLEGRMRNCALELNLKFVYDNLSFLPDGGRLALDKHGNFFLRQEMLEREITNALDMLKGEGSISRGRLLLRDTAGIGLLLNEIIPDWLKRYKLMALNAELAMLSRGGNRLEQVALECSGDGVLNEKLNYPVTYQWRCSSGSSATWSKVVEAAGRHEHFIWLDNGTLGRLTGFEDILKLNTLIQELDEENNTFEVPFAQIHYFRHLLRHWRGALPPALCAGSAATDPEAAATSAKHIFKAELRSYQVQGVKWLCKMLSNNFNVILADEMGLGKTVQALGAYNELRGRSTAPSLVICPASLVENWSRECSKFLSDCKVGVLYGKSRNQVAKSLTGCDLIITSYTMARRELAKLSKVLFNLVILDEAQHIKNPGTANAHSCKSIKAQHKLVLTGTPLENSPEDLWSIFDFLHPGLLGSFAAFRREYMNIAGSEALRNDLAARTAPFILRRVKSSVAPELPPREEVRIFCSMEPEQKKLYDELLQQGRDSLAELERADGKPQRGNMQILTTLLRLRQICCHPQLLEEYQDAAEVPSAKFELMQELLLEHIDSGHKVLLFSQFTSLLALVRQYLETADIKYSYLDGTTRNRQEVVDEFNNSPDIGVFLLSLKAGGTGLNLTSADTVMIYDPWWNPATELQAADRTHRIGQTRPVRSLKLLVKDSVEEKILELQERKRDVFDAVVDNPALAMEKFSIEDLKYLLS